MRDDNADNGYDGKGIKGPFWALFGVVTGAAAKYITNGGFGFGGPPPGGPGAPVTREVLDLTTENQALKSQLYTNELDKRQSVWNATQQARIDCIQRQLDQIFGMTRLTIPNGNLTPGVGPVTVVPVPPPAPPAPPAVSGAGATTDATLLALADAVAKLSGSQS